MTSPCTMFHIARNALCHGLARGSPRLRPYCRGAHRLVYGEHGVPEEVITLEEFDAPDNVSRTDSVLVRWMMAPVNPADINAIQGKYAILPDSLPSVPGGEGAGVAVRVGDSVSGISEGDWVVPATNMPGTWSTHVELPATDLLKVDANMSVQSAATLFINPATAYLMLKNFVDLGAGDVVVQNGANGATGRAVIQIAKKLGAATVNVVRDRHLIAELKAELEELGADHVLTEEELR